MTPLDLAYYETLSAEHQAYRQTLLDTIEKIDIFGLGQPLRACFYGSFGTGKTTEALSVLRQLLISRYQRGLPQLPLLRITAETSGANLVAPLVQAGYMVNIDVQSVCNPSKGLTAESFMHALRQGKVWIPTPQGTRAASITQFCGLLFEGLDSQADAVGSHVLQTGRQVGETSTLTWASSGIDEAGKIQESVYQGGAWNKDTYGFSQNFIVETVPYVMALPLDAVIFTTHERTAEEKDTIGGKSAASLGRVNGPAIVGGAGTRKILPKLDIVLHFEKDAPTAAQGGFAHRVYFENHPDLVSPVVNWTAISRMDPAALGELKNNITGGHPFMTLIPPSINPPRAGRGVLNFLKAMHHFQHTYWNASLQGLPPIGGVTK